MLGHPVFLALCPSFFDLLCSHRQKTQVATCNKLLKHDTSYKRNLKLVKGILAVLLGKADSTHILHASLLFASKELEEELLLPYRL